MWTSPSPPHKKFTCPSGELRTEFTSLIAKSTSSRLWDITFFTHWSPPPTLLSLLYHHHHHHHHLHHHKTPFKQWTSHVPNQSKATQQEQEIFLISIIISMWSSTFQTGLQCNLVRVVDSKLIKIPSMMRFRLNNNITLRSWVFYTLQKIHLFSGLDSNEVLFKKWAGVHYWD